MTDAAVSRPSTSLRSDLAVCGVAIDDGPAPRSDAPELGHLVLAGAGAAVPIVAHSKYRVRNGHLLLDGTDLGLDVAPVPRPRFYDLTTGAGTPYQRVARLHGPDVLAITVGDEPAVDPAELVQVAADAVRLDGVTSLVMTTGAAGGAQCLVRCVDAVARAVPALPVQVQLPLPCDPSVLAELKAVGASSIGLHAGSTTDAGRPVWREAVRLFGRNQVCTYVVVGTDTDPDEVVAGADELIRLGVYPLVVPYRPVPGTLPADAGRVRRLPSWLVAEVTDRVAELLVAAGMRGADQAAGCAACGACSCLRSAGG